MGVLPDSSSGQGTRYGDVKAAEQAAVIRAGSEAAVVILLTACATYVATLRLGRWLRVGRGLVILIAAGTCICGAAAIAAMSDVVRPRQRDLALALALITTHSSAMILALPMAADRILSQRQAAIWAGASITRPHRWWLPLPWGGQRVRSRHDH